MPIAKVRNMTGHGGAAIANQFVITEQGGIMGNFIRRETFQSYESLVAIKTTWQNGEVRVVLDMHKWDFSNTTGKYRNIFLGESKADTEKKIKSGEYKLEDLNK